MRFFQKSFIFPETSVCTFDIKPGLVLFGWFWFEVLFWHVDVVRWRKKKIIMPNLGVWVLFWEETMNTFLCFELSFLHQTTVKFRYVYTCSTNIFNERQIFTQIPINIMKAKASMHEQYLLPITCLPLFRHAIKDHMTQNNLAIE